MSTVQPQLKARESVDRVRQQILALLKKEPLTNGQLAKLLNRDRSTLWRDYINPMFKEDLIQKNGDHYALKGAAHVVIERAKFDDIVQRNAFLQLPVNDDFVAAMRKVVHGSSHLTYWHRICTGVVVPGFRCRPEHWTPETTTQFTRAFIEHKKKDRIGGYTRQALRYVHEYVIHKPLTDGEKTTLGLDGKKDNMGAYSHVRMTEQQISELAKFYLDQGDLHMAGYVAAAIETFGRPAALFDAETARFQLTERTITKATIEGWQEPIYDSKFMPILQALSLTDKRIKIESFKASAIEGQLYENKTDDIWPKRILGAQAVKIMTEVLQERRGKKTLFNWNNLKMRGRNAWEVWMPEQLRKGYRELGLTHQYFEKKPMYALRHVGAQMWLNRTGYDYAGVAEMGWTDIATLHRFYGGYSMEFFNQKVAVAYA